MYYIFDPGIYYTVCVTMLVIAVLVFVVLQRVGAGYGVFYTPKWGPSVNNRLGWILMEAPVFLSMLALWLLSPRRGEPALIVMASLFELHYFQRAFIFPFLIRGKNRMPWAIIIMGIIFNLVNSYMIGGWLFYTSPAGQYPVSWLTSPLFILGLVIFLCGFIINLHSDHIIRNLRKPGDTRHYIPYGGMFRYVTSANYLGELSEWVGFAILTWSLGGLVFAIWTFANLAPRAKVLHHRYISEFGEDYKSLGRCYMIPFIY